ncbi:hypothetical protein MKW98_023950 [Papaver atlanticum]|uniref:nucleoside-diphosphate kinase n=1 Tax=Papaver atlanticum TaxID=357466 RepID=A0AAD4SZP6_9MAGN|nr:hypothetical protein MKW98_023950 [Papaver atlanticum]
MHSDDKIHIEEKLVEWSTPKGIGWNFPEDLSTTVKIDIPAFQATHQPSAYRTSLENLKYLISIILNPCKFGVLMSGTKNVFYGKIVVRAYFELGVHTVAKILTEARSDLLLSNSAACPVQLDSSTSSRMTERTFVLAHPCHHTYRSVGDIVSVFERWDLEITEMRCMHVNKAFAHNHVRSTGSEPDEFPLHPYRNLVYYLTSNLVVAIIVEGKGAIDIVSALITDKQPPFWNTMGDPEDNFDMEDMCVFLINPLAFEDHCVGEILGAIENNCHGIRGIKLVKKEDCPSKLWTSGSAPSDRGVAVVGYLVKPGLNITSVNPTAKRINYSEGSFEIGSDYVQQSGTGKRVLENATKFFKSGFSVWACPEHSEYSLEGCMFEASLVGLVKPQ